MQIRTDFTKEQIMKDFDPLALACHPLEKLKTISSFLYAYPHGPFEMEKDDILGAASMIQDAAEEINFLVNTCNDIWREDETKKRNLEHILKNFIAYLEDPDDKPDLKTMAANLRKQMN